MRANTSADRSHADSARARNDTPLQSGPSAISSTYRPALVCAGQAIMQGKFVFSQSPSTCLFLNRFNMILYPMSLSQPTSQLTATRSSDEKCEERQRRSNGRSLFTPYLLRVKSALVSPATVTGFDWFLAPSCQAATV